MYFQMVEIWIHISVHENGKNPIFKQQIGAFSQRSNAYRNGVIDEQHGFFPKVVLSKQSYLSSHKTSRVLSSTRESKHIQFSPKFLKHLFEFRMMLFYISWPAREEVSWNGWKLMFVGQTQYVKISNQISKPVHPTLGVPQRIFHLGPLLFVLFLNDINKCFKNSSFLLFADDFLLLEMYREIWNSVDYGTAPRWLKPPNFLPL